MKQSMLTLNILHKRWCNYDVLFICETIVSLAAETPDFILPTLWPPNSPNLNQVDYKIWAVMQEMVYKQNSKRCWVTRAHCWMVGSSRPKPAWSESMTSTLCASLVQSTLYYANSIMYGMSASNMHKLQSVQNSLTRVVLPSLRHLSTSERLSYLHWLPVHYRIQFKIATLTYKTLALCQPFYDLYNLLWLHQPSRALRSSTQQLLHVPYMATALLQHGIPFLLPLKIAHP